MEATETVLRIWTQMDHYVNMRLITTLVALFGVYLVLSKFIFVPIVQRDKRNEPKKNGKGKRIGKMPPPYPNGWFKMCDSSEVKVGDVKYLQFFGNQYVLYRGEDNRVRLLDAYCPHLGANLGVHGKVKGNSIECPFHGWQFDGSSGKCSHIPYCEPNKIPDVARIDTFDVMESNQMIYMYWNGDGESFNWTVPDIPHVNEGRYVVHGCVETQVQAHIQEVPENGADIQHLNFLHVPSMVSSLPWFSHSWNVSWRAGQVDDGEDHLGFVNLQHSLLFNGMPIPGTSIIGNITQVGPGLVHLELRSPVGVFYVVETVTPIAPMKQKVTHVIYGPNNWFHQLAAKIVLQGFIGQFMRDYDIWNNKVFLMKPVLVKNDGPIASYRRWYSKFYPKGQPATTNTTGSLYQVNSLDW